MAMVEPGRTSRSGTKFADGDLTPLAQKALTAITGNDIRDLYADLLKRSERQAAHAMQGARAVMRWHSVVVADSPLARGTPGRDRIVIATGAGDPAPIPPEKLGEWWRAAAEAASRVAADYYLARWSPYRSSLRCRVTRRVPPLSAASLRVVLPASPARVATASPCAHPPAAMRRLSRRRRQRLPDRPPRRRRPGWKCSRR